MLPEDHAVQATAAQALASSQSLRHDIDLTESDQPVPRGDPGEAEDVDSEMLPLPHAQENLKWLPTPPTSTTAPVAISTDLDPYSVDSLTEASDLASRSPIPSTGQLPEDVDPYVDSVDSQSTVATPSTPLAPAAGSETTSLSVDVEEVEPEVVDPIPPHLRHLLDRLDEPLPSLPLIPHVTTLIQQASQPSQAASSLQALET